MASSTNVSIAKCRRRDAPAHLQIISRLCASAPLRDFKKNPPRRLNSLARIKRGLCQAVEKNITHCLPYPESLVRRTSCFLRNSCSWAPRLTTNMIITSPCPSRLKPSLAKSLRLLSGLAGVWLLAASSYAQQKPAARTADAPKDDTITLTPFEVITDNDVGYTAANALSGGRVNMPLKDLPIEVSVMPRQFLDDIGATGLGSAVEWTVNVVPSYTQNANSFGTYDVNFRNQGNAFNYPNYFGCAVAFDTYNIPSLEFF